VIRAVVDPNVVVSGILDLPRILKRLQGRETQARQVLAVGNFAGVMVVSAAEFLATLGET
jgi:hypothetical protein